MIDRLQLRLALIVNPLHHVLSTLDVRHIDLKAVYVRAAVKSFVGKILRAVSKNKIKPFRVVRRAKRSKALAVEIFSRQIVFEQRLALFGVKPFVEVDIVMSEHALNGGNRRVGGKVSPFD